MAQELIVCTRCLLPYGGKMKTNFLGLRKYQCPRCRLDVVYPMTLARGRHDAIQATLAAQAAADRQAAPGEAPARSGAP